MSGGRLARVLGSYQRILQNHTLVVQSLQTSALLGLGDFIAQTFFGPASSKSYDYYRTVRFAGVGLALGPGLMVWYRYLERFVGVDKSMKTCLKKVAADQLIFSPVMLGAFMGTLNLIEGLTITDFENNLRKNYVDIILNNWKVWPAVQILNFSVVPLNYRVLVVQFVALGWNTYLAWKLHQDDQPLLEKKIKQQ